MDALPSPSCQVHVQVLDVLEAKLPIQMVACWRAFEITRQSVLVRHISPPFDQLGAGTSALMCGQSIEKI